MTALDPLVLVETHTVETTIACPMCSETIPIPVYFPAPGPDTNGLWDSEIDHGYLSQHMTAVHGAAR